MNISQQEFERLSFIKKNQISKKNKKNNNEIEIEYSLNRGKFNPVKNSPNYFCNKLEFRMKTYYNYLYNLSSSPPKH